MGSINSSSVRIVGKQQLSINSQGRNLARTSGANVFNADSQKLSIIQGVAIEDRSAADFGTIPSGVDIMTTHMGNGIRESNGESDTILVRNLSGVAPSGAAYATSVNWIAHEGERVVNRRSDTDALVAREKNTSERPGG